MNATVYLVGAGPGSADLLTVKAARLLSQAHVVLHDALVCQDVLDLAPNARKILVGKRAGHVSTEQGFINRLLVASAKDGQVVVRLKGGDPMIFGRAHEEIEACRKAGINVEVVPGITTATAAAAQLVTSLTLRGVSRSVAIVTPTVAQGSVTDDSWADAAVASQTITIYMGVGEAVRVQAALLARGLSPATPVVIAHDVGRPSAGHVAGHLSDLHELGHNLGTGPRILLLGEVFASRVETSNVIAASQAQHA